MESDDEIIRRLVKERFRAVPADVHFSIGNHGDFTRDQLIQEVEHNTEIGKAAIEMQVEFIRRMPSLIATYGRD